MMMKILLTFTVLLGSFVSDAYKILAVFPIPSRSHGILGDGYVKHLLAAGHEVTYITPFPKKNPPANLHQVDVSANNKVFSADTIHMQAIMDKVLDLKDRDFMFYLMANISKATVENENVQKLLRDPNQHFDLVIAEWMFNEMYSAYFLLSSVHSHRDPIPGILLRVETQGIRSVHGSLLIGFQLFLIKIVARIPPVFGCPLIWSSSMESHWMILSLIDEPLNPAYNPHFLHSRELPLTFLQRVEELWTQLQWTYKRNHPIYNIQQSVYETHIVPILEEKGIPVPSFDDLRYNASLVLGNSHVSLGRSIRVPPNYKGIGGYHVDTKITPLPEDLQTIMDNSSNGVVYFSMGSNMKSKDLPKGVKTDLLKMFGELNQTVIWKFEELLPNLPKNVHIRSWAPQQSVLSHPNCKLFITHGGLLSTTEAIHYGVPLVGIPVFADQFNNVDMAVLKGYGQRVHLSYTMANELKKAIQEVLSKPK